MIIYGTALLAICLLAGLCIGRSIGWMLGVDGDIGGVGLSMILLILSQDWLHRKGLMAAPSNQGIAYWGAMYVPIVVAMAASQNVMGAVNGGLMALVAGLLTVAVAMAAVGFLTRFGTVPLREEKDEPTA